MSLYRTSSVSRKFDWIFESLEPFSHEEYESQGRYYTKDFNIFFNEISTKWRFVVEFKNRWIGLFLQKIEASSNDFNVILDVTAQIGESDEYSRRKVLRKTAGEISTECGWEQLIKIDDFIDIAAENNRDYEFDSYDELTFKLKVTLCEIKKSKSKTAKIFLEDSDIDDDISKYGKLHNSDTLSDFTFICSDGMKIPAHRKVLAVFSPVMQAMLNAPMSESTAQSAKVDDIDGETMIEVLRFMYQKRVENVNKLASKLLYAAEKYDMEGLKDFCASSIAKTHSNVIQYMLIAEQYNATELLMSCIKYIKCNYNAVRHHEDWKKLSSNILTALVDIFEAGAQEPTVFVTDLEM